MRFRLLRHPHQGWVIRAFDNLGGPPAYSIQYDLTRLRDPAVRWGIRQALKRDLKILREALVKRLDQVRTTTSGTASQQFHHRQPLRP